MTQFMTEYTVAMPESSYLAADELQIWMSDDCSSGGRPNPAGCAKHYTQ